MKEENYKINNEDKEQLEYVEKMLRDIPDVLHEICEDEKDDINIGYELGKLQNNLANLHIIIAEINERLKN